MQNSQNLNSRTKSIVFVDYKPAELKINKDWIIVYYAKNPINGLLERQRLRAPSNQSKTERLKHGKRIVSEINMKLASGWSPYLEESGKNYKSLATAIDEFLKHIRKQIADNVFRPDTLRTYNSNLNLIKQFIQEKRLNVTFALEINRKFCIQYLDWVYLDRNNSPRTRNNHLNFLKLFCEFILSRGILNENPAIGIAPMKLPTKTRTVFPEAIKTALNKKLLTYDSGFRVLCMATYYCFIRNSELGKLTVKNLNLKENSIFIPKEISKNKKDEFVTIPTPFLEMLINHLKNANENDFVFSSDNFNPGPKKMPVRKIATAWEKIRTDLNLENKYQFYSLKDTGITDLLNSGIAAIKVRDQARHYDIKITEIYTPRNKSCDEVIRNSNVTFL